jgi:hypothetical protein
MLSNLVMRGDMGRVADPHTASKQATPIPPVSQHCNIPAAYGHRFFLVNIVQSL